MRRTNRNVAMAPHCHMKLYILPSSRRMIIRDSSDEWITFVSESILPAQINLGSFYIACIHGNVLQSRSEYECDEFDTIKLHIHHHHVTFCSSVC